uniref:Uncharacterized protein n=1 Tax=Ochrobactrum phage ORM_20 TaxID=2985243 RepID=A0A9N6ZF17_9VIRU|nr:hypothetical protein ORM20_00132 [Ochrobactrum phage ORM_20]
MKELPQIQLIKSTIIYWTYDDFAQFGKSDRLIFDAFYSKRALSKAEIQEVEGLKTFFDMKRELISSKTYLREKKKEVIESYCNFYRIQAFSEAYDDLLPLFTKATVEIMKTMKETTAWYSSMLNDILTGDYLKTNRIKTAILNS